MKYPESIDKIPKEILDKVTEYSFEFSYGSNSLSKLKGFNIIFRSPSCMPTKKELKAEEEKFIEISKKRREELENLQTYYKYRSKIKDIQIMDTMYPSMLKEDSDITYGDLPF